MSDKKGRCMLMDAPGVRALSRIDEAPVGCEMRYYYVVDEGALFHLVSRAGVVEFLEGKVVEVLIGWGEGWHGKCLPQHEGLQLCKVTVLRECDGEPDFTLSAIIENSRHLPRRRPPKGAAYVRRWGGER